ncbi:MAG: hypothetical protein ACYTET_06000, partial [Planctomycetota bacterium]
NVTSDQTQNFTSPLPLTISGYIRTAQSEAIAGVIVSADNGGSIDLTDADGYYQVIIPAGWSGTVTPRRIGYTFDPPQRSYVDLQDYLYNEDFQGLLHNMKVYCWGDGVYGQCDGPVDNQFVTAIAAGHSHSLAVKSDGTVDAWGENTYGQSNLPATNTDFVNVAAGSTHSLGIKKDGSIDAWGNNNSGQCDVPTPNRDYLMISAGGAHSLALKSDGSIAAWGANNFGQTDVPSPNESYIGIAAGQNFSLGLKTDGSITAWGDNHYGQLDIGGDPNAIYIAISAGGQHALALELDGSIWAWGFNGDGQTVLPEAFVNSDFIAVSAGLRHSLALKADGSIVGWGNDAFGQTAQQLTLNQDFEILRAGGWHSLGVKMVIDLSGNGCVNNDDYTIFSSQWLRTDCAYPDFCQGADFQQDGDVDLDDLGFLSNYWLSECE